jgi:hypothetical protein
MAILPKAIYVFNAIPFKTSKIKFITEIERSSLKFIWKHKKLQITKTILSKKSNTEVITMRTGRDEQVGVVIHICREITQRISLSIYLYLKLAKTGSAWRCWGMAGKGIGG